ncbi:hypothetical protein [Burkholderia ubonensis]|uniref:hypothetical protein n=1 Tax=Burkholderia ubonensis TaxID=101571 RepID=UPI00075C132D|nr:hypothetical protein [Burkholderia ubonensis]KVV07436.1 hypothetical protein WK77_16750 [Burkholderia ubonensis]
MKVRQLATSLRVRSFGKGALLMGAGAALATGIAVMAQQSSTDAAASSTNCAVSTAAQSALNGRITMIGMTQPDPSKYFTVGGVSSCIGSLSNIDLSKLIPDPMGILTSLAQQALQMGVNAACTAARNSLSDLIGKYNFAAGMLNNGSGMITGYLDQQIGKSVGVALTTYGTNYAAPPGTPTTIDPLSGITGALNNSVGSTASQFTSTAQSAAQSAASAVTAPVTAAANSALSAPSSLGSKIFGGN